MNRNNNNERPISGPGTVVGTNVTLTGTLKDMGDVAIHGTVEGEIISERSIVVGETANIKGPVSGQIITLAGTVRGSIDAGQKLEIMPTGKVFGSISTRELIIRSGAIFVGKSTMPVEESVEGRPEDDEARDSDDVRAFAPHAMAEQDEE
jgi:cytoskeletal protein CcmA (bactofilin family)